VRAAAESPELICVNDGAHVTTLFPVRGLYSRHAAASPQASLEANKMLNLSLQGSAIDILLASDVAGAVSKQASDLRDHGQTILDGKRAHHFELCGRGQTCNSVCCRGARRCNSPARHACRPETVTCRPARQFQWKPAQRG
jgi:hypothetical protein